MTRETLASLISPSPDTTSALARRLAPSLRPGDTLCLEGGLGAGKSHFARAVIGELTGEAEIPSPTYTIVQTYPGPVCEIWHADLYRLAGPEEVLELGLSEAFDTAIALVEWPDRLDPPPPEALWLTFEPGPEADARRIIARGPASRWSETIARSFDISAADA